MDQLVEQRIEVTVVDGLVVIDGKPALAATLAPPVAAQLAEDLGAAVVVAYAHGPKRD